MIKEIYNSKADAQSAATSYAADCCGYVSDRLGCCDDSTTFDYIERGLPAWSGETPAFRVIAGDGSDYALIAYLED